MSQISTWLLINLILWFETPITHSSEGVLRLKLNFPKGSSVTFAVLKKSHTFVMDNGTNVVRVIIF